MQPILGTTTMVQVGIVVHNIDATKAKWAQFLGMSAPETLTLTADPKLTEITYKAQPSTHTTCKLAIFHFGNVQMDLIEPDDCPSSWRTFLEEKGEGIHHIAFGVTDTQDKLDKAAEMGIGVLQRAKFGNLAGEYVYLDSQAALGCIVETLESY